MDIIQIIENKKNKLELTTEEIQFIIDNYLNENIKDYQMSSLLMAITINGMSKRETFDLTKAMLNSGEKIDLSKINGVVVDKHSTGGVGDKTTLILAALVASCGVNVAKMSGRGLGHTGGTIDKLESIGVNTETTFEEFVNQVNTIGVAIVGQMGNLVPADKKIYALRDVTATVESIPLIASSIMSKKLASGADKIVIDLKVGNGALIKNIKDAKLALNEARKISEKLNMKIYLIDSMYTLDRDKLLFRFLSDTRVDFRELAKELANKYKTRIELRQIGARDKAKEIGGYGPCGRKLCCSSFLNNMDSVSVNMAKNQNVSLNPNKINGLCGRLLCCLTYEDDNYKACKKNLPSVGQSVKIPEGKGKVISVDILKQSYKVNIDDKGIIEVKICNECS